MPDQGQQREAIMAAWEAIRPRTTNKLMEPKIYFDAGVEAALAAGEDTERPDDVKVARETLAIIEALGRDALETPQELALRARSAMRLREFARDTEQEPER